MEPQRWRRGHKEKPWRRGVYVSCFICRARAELHPLKFLCLPSPFCPLASSQNFTPLPRRGNSSTEAYGKHLSFMGEDHLALLHSSARRAVKAKENSDAAYAKKRTNIKRKHETKTYISSVLFESCKPMSGGGDAASWEWFNLVLWPEDKQSSISMVGTVSGYAQETPGDRPGRPMSRCTAPAQ